MNLKGSLQAAWDKKAHRYSQMLEQDTSTTGIEALEGIARRAPTVWAIMAIETAALCVGVKIDQTSLTKKKDQGPSV